MQLSNNTKEPAEKEIAIDKIDKTTEWLKQENKESEEHWAAKGLKEGFNFAHATTIIGSEPILQHKYSRLSNASYDYFNSKGNENKVHTNLTDKKYNYIEDLKGFKVDNESSNLENLVLHNSKTGETHVSFRGTTDNPLRTKSLVKDWKINGEIAGGNSHTSRVKSAEKQMDKPIGKYGKEHMSLSGQSQGAHVSYEMGVKNDIHSYTYNPAINLTQVEDAAKYSANKSTQTIVKTLLDFASGLAYKKRLKASNTEVKIVDKNSKLLDKL